MTKSNIYLFSNWKMYLDLAESEKLAKALVKNCKKMSKKIKMAIFPSALSFVSVAKILKKSVLQIGAQNMHFEDKGGFTGEVAATMYKASGANYVLVGHSERRHLFHETNHEVQMKMEAALNNKLIPILCVGETIKEREERKAKEVVEIQLRSALHGVVWSKNSQLIVAYEPVWAIGTGKHCDPAEAQKMSEIIFQIVDNLAPGLKLIVLYGGSVNGENVADFMKQPNINGILVGGASSKLDSWMQIMHNAL
jgi:triosephosphate isomerase